MIPLFIILACSAENKDIDAKNQLTGSLEQPVVQQRAKSGNENPNINKKEAEEIIVITGQVPEATRKRLWHDAVSPIIAQDKKAFIKTVQFPIAGELGDIIMPENPQTVITPKVLYDNFNKVFNAEFMHALKGQTYHNMDIFKQGHDTIYTLGVGKTIPIDGDSLFIAEASVRLHYVMKNDSLRLFFIGRAGGDFYEK